ncbi:MAG: class I tRNA ligase family protein, partial [Oscillospiraceae bacterium]|nr:class I tRNA ligase family protein [Oscillospiraceae bacterium]
ELKALAADVLANYEKQMDAFQFSMALNEVFRLLDRANKYIDETTPWILAKSEETKPRLLSVMKNLCECIRLAAILLTPFMPESAAKILDLLNVPAEGRTFAARCYCADETAVWHTAVGEPLFPRIDMEKELKELEELSKPAKPALEIEPYATEFVDFDTFCKSDFRAVKVVDCQNVKKSDKLLQFTLDDGTGTPRQILSGIAKFYKPEALIGKTLVAITNLPPRKMMGRESCGMLISAVHTENGEEKLNLLMVSDAIPAGAKLG